MLTSVKPGDLIRPKKNWIVNTWDDVLRNDDGSIERMKDQRLKTSSHRFEGFAIVVAVDANPDALLLWYHDDLVWVWKRTIVLVKS
jgi:hypothetical protein